MSRRRAGTPAFANCAAIRELMVPAPRTPTRRSVRILVSVLECSRQARGLSGSIIGDSAPMLLSDPQAVENSNREGLPQSARYRDRIAWAGVVLIIFLQYCLFRQY